MKAFSALVPVLAGMALAGCASDPNSARDTARAPDAQESGTASPNPVASEDSTVARAAATSPPPVAGSTPAGSAPAPGSTSTGANTPTPPPVSNADGTVQLRFAYESGTQYKFATTASVQSEGMAQGKPVKSGYETASDLIVKITGVSGSTATVETSSANFKMTGGGSDPQSQQIKQMMEQSKDLVTKATYDALGKPSGNNPDLEDPMRSMLNGVGASLGFMGLNYPAKAIKLGDTWSVNFDLGKIITKRMPPGMNASVKGGVVATNYTLTGIDQGAGVATIKVSMKGAPSISLALPEMTDPKTGKKTKMPPMNMSIGVTSTGTMKVDLKTGVPLEATSESTSSTSGTRIMDGKQRTISKMKRA